MAQQNKQLPLQMKAPLIASKTSPKIKNKSSTNSDNNIHHHNIQRPNKFSELMQPTNQIGHTCSPGHVIPSPHLNHKLQIARDQGYMVPIIRDQGHIPPLADLGQISPYGNQTSQVIPILAQQSHLIPATAQTGHVPSGYLVHPSRKFISPVTLSHVTPGDSINIETSQQPPASPIEYYREGYTGYSEEYATPGAYSIYQTQDNFIDTVDRTSLAESGDSGVSGTPDNFISESSGIMNQHAPPYPQIGYSGHYGYRQGNQIDYRQMHYLAQRARSSQMPTNNPTQIDFSCKVQLKPSETSFGIKIGEGGIIERVEKLGPASNEDVEIGDRVVSMNGRLIEGMMRDEISDLLDDAAKHRSITFGLRRLMRTTQPLQRTYTLDLPVEAPSPDHNILLPGYIQPTPNQMTRYLSCHQLPPPSIPPLDDSSFWCRHSWPHAPQQFSQQMSGTDDNMVSVIPPPQLIMNPKGSIGDRSMPTPDMNEQSSSILTPIQELPSRPGSGYNCLQQVEYHNRNNNQGRIRDM